MWRVVWKSRERSSVVLLLWLGEELGCWWLRRCCVFELSLEFGEVESDGFIVDVFVVEEGGGGKVHAAASRREGEAGRA